MDEDMNKKRLEQFLRDLAPVCQSSGDNVTELKLNVALWFLANGNAQLIENYVRTFYAWLHNSSAHIERKEFELMCEQLRANPLYASLNFLDFLPLMWSRLDVDNRNMIWKWFEQLNKKCSIQF